MYDFFTKSWIVFLYWFSMVRSQIISSAKLIESCKVTEIYSLSEDAKAETIV